MMQNLKNSTEKNIILLKKRALYYLGKREYSRLELQKKINAFAQELELETQTVKIYLTNLKAKIGCQIKDLRNNLFFQKRTSME